MTDRDRLAADLRDNALLATVGVRDNEHYWPALADRLIALGWARLSAPSASTHSPQIDEERLARALLATQGYTMETHRYVYGDDVDILDAPHEWYDSTRNLAAEIAAAYREDTDAATD